MLKLIAFAGALAFGVATASADIAPPPAQAVPPDVFVKGIYDTKLESEAASPELGRAMTDSLILTHFDAELLALSATRSAPCVNARSRRAPSSASSSASSAWMPR